LIGKFECELFIAEYDSIVPYFTYFNSTLKLYSPQTDAEIPLLLWIAGVFANDFRGNQEIDQSPNYL